MTYSWYKSTCFPVPRPCLLNFPTKGLCLKRQRYFHIFQVEANLTYCEDNASIYLNFIEVLSSLKRNHIVSWDASDWNIGWVFCCVKCQSCFARINLDNLRMNDWFVHVSFTAILWLNKGKNYCILNYLHFCLLWFKWPLHCGAFVCIKTNSQ